MKYFSFLLLLFSISCAISEKSPAVKASRERSVKSIDEKKELIKKMLDEHPEYSQKTKDKIQSILISSLNTIEDLRKRESQLIQQIAHCTMVEEKSFEEMSALKRELKKVYNQKYENLEKAVNQLKALLGVTPENNYLTNDAFMGFFNDRD
jgi:chromosome segregation ATPase